MKRVLKNKYIMPLVLLLLAGALVLFSLPVTVLPSVKAAGGTVTAVDYNDVEVVIYGEVVDIKATVTRDGVSAPETVKYTDLNAISLNTVFTTQTVHGYVDGWSEVITQKILVVPDDLEYLINLGANQTSNLQGAIADALLLDHTGENSADNVYHQAILRRFPDLRNRLAAKQYGVNVQADGDYGYTGTAPVAKTNTESANIYQNIVYNQWGNQLLEVTAHIPSGSYDVYIGMYNYWSHRPVTVKLNDEVVHSAYMLKSQDLIKFKKVSPVNGKITVSFTGTAQYSEPMMSFVSIAQADNTVYPELAVPAVQSVMELEDSSLEVTGLDLGAKLMVYNEDTGILLYEKINTAKTDTVTFTDGQLEGLYRICFIQMSPGFISDVALSQRTDIKDLTLDYVEDYTPYDLQVKITCSAVSLINTIIVRLGNVQNEIAVQSETEQFEHTVILTENGDYEITLLSGKGSAVTRFSVSNIDNQAAALGLNVSLASSKLSSKQKIVMDAAKGTVAPTTEFGYYYNGQKTELSLDASRLEFTKSGEYTVYFVNGINKSASRNVKVAFEETSIQTVKLTRSITQKTDKQVNVTFESANGYEYESATVYYKNAEGNTEKMIVNGNTFAAFNNGLYFAQVTSKDGTTEIMVLEVQNIIKGNSMSAGTAVAIALPATLVVAAAAVFCAVWFVILKKHKKPNQQEN